MMRSPSQKVIPLSGRVIQMDRHKFLNFPETPITKQNFYLFAQYIVRFAHLFNKEESLALAGTHIQIALASTKDKEIKEFFLLI